MEFVSLTIPTNDAYFLESIAHTTERIIKYYGVTPQVLKNYERATFQTVDNEEFIKRMPKFRLMYFERLPRKQKKRLKKEGLYFHNFYIKCAV